MIELTKDYIENLKSIIEAKDDAKAQEVLHELYPADIAELYQELNLQEAIYLYLLMDGDKAADVLMELDEEDRHKLLKELPNDRPSPGQRSPAHGTRPVNCVPAPSAAGRAGHAQ